MSKTTWTTADSTSRPRYPRLRGILKTDVAIIGGGLTGITAAYLLRRSGKNVVVLEQGEIGDGATGMTTAFLTQRIDTDFVELRKLFGGYRAKQVLESHRQAIDEVESVIEREGLDCEFARCDNYVFALTDRDRKRLDAEREEAVRLGLAVRDAGDLAFPNRGAFAILNQAKFHPMKYLVGLAERAAAQGVLIFEGTKAEGIEPGPVVACDDGKVEAEHVIAATYAPFGRPLSLYFKKAFYTSYVFECRIPGGMLPAAIYEDLRNPYHYFRVDAQGDYDRLVIGGEDHRSDLPIDPLKNYRALERYLRETLGGIPYEIRMRWRGPVLEPVDGLAYIGPAGEPDVSYAFGFSGNGMTYAMIAAQIFRDSLAGEKNEWEDLYDAARVPTLKQLFGKGGDYAGEFFGGAVKNVFRRKR